MPKKLSIREVGLLVLAALFVVGCAAANPSGVPPQAVQAATVASIAQYQEVARSSLDKLCGEYSCPQGYVESALPRIQFLSTAEFVVEAKKDGNTGVSTENVIAFTTSKKEPRWIFVDMNQINKVSDRLGFLEWNVDHEAVHQIAVEQKITEPLVINFSNSAVFAGVKSYGLRLLDAQDRYNLNFANEAYTEWLAEPLHRKNFPGLGKIYTDGPRVVEKINLRLGLDRKVAFGLYTSKGLDGFLPYYEKLVTDVLTTRQHQTKRTASLYIVLFVNQTLIELNNGDYSLTEAQKRIDGYIATGLAPAPQKK